MRKTALKLGISLAIMPLSVLLLGLTHNALFFLSLVTGLLFAILFWFDLGRQLRNLTRPSRAEHTLGILMGVPQALFGLICAAIGMAIVLWVLYNTFVERQPRYIGGFMTLGLGPALALFGFGWVVTAFRRGSDGPDEA